MSVSDVERWLAPNLGYDADCSQICHFSLQQTGRSMSALSLINMKHLYWKQAGIILAGKTMSKGTVKMPVSVFPVLWSFNASGTYNDKENLNSC